MFYVVPRTEYHKRRVPVHLQGIVIDGRKLGEVVYVPLRDGMTEAKAVAFTEHLIARARHRVSYRLSDADAWKIATAICEEFAKCDPSTWCLEDQLTLIVGGRYPNVREWLKRAGRTFSVEDTAKIVQWWERVSAQRARVASVQDLVKADDPEALQGLPVREEPRSPQHTPAKLIASVRAAAGRKPLLSEFTREFFEAKRRSFNYRSALRQFITICGDKDVHLYTPDDCWRFRNWLDTEARDEKKGEPLAGQTKVHKLGAARTLFDFAIERRHRNDNPMANVKTFSKTENIKKYRRLYTEGELKALFVDAQPDTEWQRWLPRLALYAGMRLREVIQLRPHDVTDDFGVWHIVIRPGRGQRVKGNKTRPVPIHKELIRLGFVKLAQQAQREQREWLFKDVPLVAARGKDFNVPDVETVMVPSQNAATQWFGRYSSERRVTDPNVDLHALRGAFTTYLSQQGKDLSLRMEIVGHSKGSAVHNRYIYEGSSLKDLKGEINRIKYPITIPA